MHLQIQNETEWRGAPRFILTGKWASCYPALEPGAPTSGMSMLRTSDCGCDSHLGALGDSGTLTAAQALQAAMAMYSGQNFNPKDAQSYPTSSAVISQIEAGAFSPYSGCGTPAKNMSLLTTTSGISLSIGGATTGILVATHVISAVTGAVLGAATLGVGALISVIGMIFAHHAAAVQRDMNFICGALPAVNNAFAVIKQALAAGQTTPAAAAAALDEIYSQFMTAGGASGSASGPGNIPDSGVAINKHPYCNAACELSMVLKAMVLYWQSQFMAKAGAPAAAAAPGGTPTPAGTLVSMSTTPQATGGTLVSMATGQPVAAPAPAASSGLSLGLIAAGLVGAFFLFK